jgi:glyoxylase-like metal-dependent hydrolase (beta-lactamase superfamily II)
MRENIELPIDTIQLADGLSWEDGWFATGQLDDGTLAIGEPAYHQRNWSYLIADGDEALLFDTGSGRRPIAPLVARHAGGASVTAFPSHMHFDHLGGIGRSDRLWWPTCRCCVHAKLKVSSRPPVRCFSVTTKACRCQRV